ncbi:cupin domain-containing protein [Altericista sp. CCNU0014]|uniref:cupin domain-containing protein n=1 Tax=Altericista sp. CCNU0014 TaxID=3082949 RepID=UPI00384D6EF7
MNDRDFAELAALYLSVPGTLLGTLSVDLQKREIQCFVRSWSNASFPKHRHFGDEEIVILEGDLNIGDRSYQPGDRITSVPGTVHQPKTDRGCLLFLRTSLDDELLA